MSPSPLGLLSLALSSVAAALALLAAVWSRSGAQKVDALAATVIPLLSRVKQKVDPDLMVAAVVAAAATAPPPAIVEPTAAPPVGAAPLPVIVMDDDDERQESVPVHTERVRIETAQDETDTRWRAGAPSLLDAAGPPSTGPSVSGERSRRDAIAMPTVDARGAVVRRLPPPPLAKQTLTSLGIAPGPRQRFDPRVEPDSNVGVLSPHRAR